MNDKKSVPPFAALRAFEAYGRLGGFRKAAQALSVDHAVISRHLRALEAIIGTALIERQRGAEHWLTADGRAYHARISKALDDIAAATDALRHRHQDRFLIWCSPGFANNWLLERLMDFNARFPAIDLALRPSDEPVKFTINEADGDIRYLRNGDEAHLPAGLRRDELARPNVFPVASPRFVATMEDRLNTVHDLLQFRLLHEDGDLEWRTWLSAHGITHDRPLPGPRLWHANTTMDAARSGQGIALTNHFLLAKSLEDGTLVKVLPRQEPLRRVELGAYNLIAREDRWNNISLIRFRQWIREGVQKSGHSEDAQ
ncbi:LysR substrate-binding domain-containing protein [Sphingomonas sp.]|uniref:LysR substrate-binding domain-containing protein n=1 Tax=Sphingomonas sp. TaxID=28214 RepID=UPI000DB2AA19|nr:LysR substrate-binding domain-containing protein [Sphingomonas sp.]PZU06110.1 MAG: LysR family transcriptional regulator [Sphingomonas sp.]